MAGSLPDVFIAAIDQVRILGYWIVFFAALLESLAFVGVLIPGMAIVILAGFLSGQGSLDFGDLIWFTAFGAIIGDGISYLFGRKGVQLFDDNSRFFKKSYLEKGELFFTKHGNKSIFLGKFIGPVRSAIPFIAGLFKMSPKRFLVLNVLSSFTWAIVYLLIGYFFGSAWQSIGTWSTRIGIIAVSIGIIVGIIYYVRHRRRLANKK